MQGDDAAKRKQLLERLAAIREAHESVMSAKLREMAALDEELTLVQADIASLEHDERRVSRKLQRLGYRGAGGGAALTIGCASPTTTTPSTGGDGSNDEKSLVKNFLSTLLEFNEGRSKKR